MSATDYPSSTAYATVEGLAQRESGVHNATLAVESGLDRIAKQIDRAHEALGLVLQPEQDQINARAAEVDALMQRPTSPHTNRLRGVADRANALADQLSELLDRLDV